MTTLHRNITASDYLQHTKPATEALFGAISTEKARLEKILIGVSQRTISTHADFITSELNDDFDEVGVQHKYGVAAEANMQEKLVLMSLEVLSGSVLQIAKQGISIMSADNSKFTRGRCVHGMPISEIIRHGRNQAMHWEEDELNSKTKICFDALKDKSGNQFDLNVAPKNKAWELLKSLGWHDYEKYKEDMEEILK
jgi:hypothetical protein